MHIGAALRLAAFGDLHMRIEQRRKGGEGHQNSPERFGVFPEPFHARALYSAATGTDGAIGRVACASMRASMTWRKWRISPCTGQAAASPSAQMV